MSIIADFKEQFNEQKEIIYTIDEYLEACKTDPSLYLGEERDQPLLHDLGLQTLPLPESAKCPILVHLLLSFSHQ